MIDDPLRAVPFEGHVELLRLFLAHRADIVEKLQGVLNAQRKPIEHLQDRPQLARDVEDCFFSIPGLSPDQTRLRGQLEAAHRASGFEPHRIAGLHNDLIDAAEMMIRGFYCWRQTRWPGRNGRVRYAQTLFNVHVLRSLELLSMRLWDAGPSDAGARLARVQRLLDALWRSAPADQAALVSDARWLIPLAQSPTTDELAAYFEIAERIAESFTEADRIEIRRASVAMIGGHLRSQIRHYCMKDGVSIDERSVVLRTRTSNALDFALLVQGLVALLAAYAHARDGGDVEKRLELAAAICQGVSPDPELLVDRLDLLGAYTMIEHVFITTDHDGPAHYTPSGRRHVALLREYTEQITRLAGPLHDDCAMFKPVDGSYSPYGAIYGTPSNLTEHMALKAIQSDAMARFGLEDVFSDGDADTLAWVNGWRRLPHIAPEVQALHEYPQSFAEEIFARIERALGDAAGRDENDAARTGRLMILGEAEDGSSSSSIAALPIRYVGSSDPEIVAAHKAVARDQTDLLDDRREGHFVVSYRTSGGWVAINKEMLTELLGAGRDVKIVGLPRAAAGVLALMCRDLLAELPPRL